MLRNSSAKFLFITLPKLRNLVIFKSFNKLTFQRSIFIDNRIGDRKKIYNDRKLVGFSMEQMYSVVSDVGNYHKFVPFCKKSNILKKTAHYLLADLIVGFPPIMESYTSNVTLIKPRMVKAICKEGRLFNHLDTTWKFSPALKNNLQSCIIDFHISFEFRSVFHSHLAHYFFDTLVRQMEVAFINEAKVRFGKESVPSQRLEIIHSRTS